MKTFFMSIAIICVILAITSLIYAGYWYGYKYPSNYEYALNLADDASLPLDKANYLREYKNKIQEIQGEPRWIFKKKDINLNTQLIILDGLIKRFDDISKISASDMSYQQGMYQLSGQEMDSQLERISGIFESAKVRENPVVAIFMWCGWLIFGLFPFVYFSILDINY